MLTEQFDNVTLHRCDYREVYDSWDRQSAIVSDPPYGMGYNTNHRRFTGGKSCDRLKQRVAPPIVGDDQPFDPAPFLHFRECIFFGANHFAQKLPRGTILIWIKKNEPMFGKFLSDAEIAWKKGGHGVYCYKSIYANPTRRRDAGGDAHPTQKPIDLMHWCIGKTKSPVVIDPYMGSGSTGIAAYLENREFVGCEIDQTYFDLACRRIEKTVRENENVKP